MGSFASEVCDASMCIQNELPAMLALPAVLPGPGYGTSLDQAMAPPWTRLWHLALRLGCCMASLLEFLGCSLALGAAQAAAADRLCTGLTPCSTPLVPGLLLLPCASPEALAHWPLSVACHAPYLPTRRGTHANRRML